MPNPFTDESRDPRWEVGVKGFIDQLRAPTSLDFLKHTAKPMDKSLGDFVLKASLDQYLIAEIIAGRYDTVYATLVGIFGDRLTAVSAPPISRKPLTPVRAADNGQKHAKEAVK